MVEVPLMHAGEEALFVLVPVGLLLFLDDRRRRRESREQAMSSAGAPETRAGGPGGTPD